MDDNDGPEFVSPPFPIIFLTVAKVILSSVIILAALAFLGMLVFVLGGAAWFAVT